MDDSRKTTGQQLGLLGSRFDGGIAGSQSGSLFGDVRKPAPTSPTPDQQSAEDRLIARKFANCKSGDLYE